MLVRLRISRLRSRIQGVKDFGLRVWGKFCLYRLYMGGGGGANKIISK